MSAHALRVGAALATCLALMACGGGGGPEPATVTLPAPAPAPAPTLPLPSSNVPTGHVLVWSDEFSTDGLPDPTRWDHDTERNRAGWYNNERQYYARDRPQNAVVAGGTLRITARLESLSSAADWGGQRYTSARLLTRGTWPAIWMLGTGGTWPDDGEIDIMEQVGSNPSRVFGTVHTRAGSGGASTGAATQVATACTAFHDYQLHWTANEIAIGVNGVVYFRYANPGTGRDRWPFNSPQYLLLNIAIGGNLGGSIDDSIFPVTMEIDHVRIYQARP